MTQQLAELHLHFQQCIQPIDLLKHHAQAKNVDWEWYEDNYKTAYSLNSPAKQLVDQYQNGDDSAINDFKQLCVYDEKDAGNFLRFLAKSNLFWAGSYRNNNTEANEQELLTFALGIKRDYIKQGINYAEFRHTGDPALLKIFNKDNSQLKMRLAVSLDRNNPWKKWEHVKQMALGDHGESLTAVDFCNKEEGYPPKNIASFFEEVKKFNQNNPNRALAILYHVGESFNDKSLESAIRWVQEVAEMGAHRLGHAIALGIDPAMYGEHTRKESVAERKDQITYDLQHQDGLRKFGVIINTDQLNSELSKIFQLPENETIEIQYNHSKIEEIRNRQKYAIECIKATGAVIEVCPTSNMRIAGITNIKYHPIHRFVAENMSIVISTDDPGLFGITLEHELDWVEKNVKNGFKVKQDILNNTFSARSEVLSGRVI